MYGQNEQLQTPKETILQFDEIDSEDKMNHLSIGHYWKDGVRYPRDSPFKPTSGIYLLFVTILTFYSAHSQ